MTFKSITLAAALFALPLGISASITGGAALAATVGGGGGGGGNAGSNSSPEGGTSEAAVPAGLCVPASSYSLAEARRHTNDGCPKTVTIRIGTLYVN
jgi:hypothetical protein